MTELTTLTHEGPVATLTLRRPEVRNALSVDLLNDLHARVAALGGSKDVSVLVLTGEGRAFCAGMDLKAVLDDADAALRLLRSLADLTLALRALPMVTLARVNGAAIGGGCGLACVCDIAITHADSRMGFPEVDLGVCPAVVAPWLVKKIGAGRARRVLLSGGVMSGAEAHALGIVDHLAPDAAGLDTLCTSLTSRLATGGHLALLATKELLNRLDHSIDTPVLHAGAELSAAIVSSDETRAILRARLKG